jgi:hypothetical protein
MMDTYGLFLLAINMYWTVAIFTFLLGENPIYRLMENQLLAIAMAWTFVLGVKQIMDTGRDQLLIHQQYIWILPFILGICLYVGKVRPKYSWVSRYPVAIMVGAAVGLATRAAVEAQITLQLVSTFLPLWTPNAWTTFNNIVIVLCVVSVLFYFFFARTPRRAGAIQPARQWINIIGRAFMMLTFGTYFGNRMMGQVVLLIDRIGYLLGVTT